MNKNAGAYQLEDLREWVDNPPSHDPPVILSVFGDPVKHSLSPQMHNPALKKSGINGQYIKIKSSKMISTRFIIDTKPWLKRNQLHNSFKVCRIERMRHY